MSQEDLKNSLFKATSQVIQKYDSEVSQLAIMLQQNFANLGIK